MLGQIVIQYEVQSKSNATDEIKQKLLLVHKNVFSQNFPPVYCWSERTFQCTPTTARSRRRTGFWSWNAWPPPRSSSSPPGVAWQCTADYFLWLTGNTLWRTNKAKTVHFWELGSRRRPTKYALRRRRGRQFWSLIATFFTRPSFLCKMLKIVLTGPDGLRLDTSKCLGNLLNLLVATAAIISWNLLVFFQFSGGAVPERFWQPWIAKSEVFYFFVDNTWPQ